MPNGKVVGPGSVLTELLEVDQRGIIVLFHNTLVNAAVESSPIGFCCKHRVEDPGIHLIPVSTRPVTL